MATANEADNFGAGGSENEKRRGMNGKKEGRDMAMK
jgi:hypothetical protein